MMQLFVYELKLEMSFNLFKSEEDPALIEIHISVGKTLTKLSDFYNAQKILEWGLKIALAMFISTPDHPLIAQCKLHLGLFHLEKAHNLGQSKEDKQKLLKDAEKYLTEALEMQEKVYTEQGKKHMTMVNTYGGLARLARMKDSKEDASEKIKIGLNMLEEILSPELLSKSLTKVKLLMIKGDIEADQGDNDNARKTFESALDMLKNIFKGTFHLTLIETSLDLLKTMINFFKTFDYRKLLTSRIFFIKVYWAKPAAFLLQVELLKILNAVCEIR